MRDEPTAVHEVDLVERACDFLNMPKSLRHIVEVGVRGVIDLLILPICEAIAKTGYVLATEL